MSGEYLYSISAAESLEFARASGDCNPLHTDPKAVVGNPYGVAVLHGAHVILWAVRTIFPEPITTGLVLSVRFVSPARPGERLSLLVRGASATVNIGHKIIAVLSWKVQAQASDASAPASPQWERVSWSLRPSSLLGHERFWLTRMAWASFVAGMLLSKHPTVMTEMRLLICDVAEASTPTGLDLHIQSDSTTLEGFARLGADSAELALLRIRSFEVRPIAHKLIGAQQRRFDFGGSQALVIGGTRGVGLEIARLLARFGARVTVTGRSPLESRDLQRLPITSVIGDLGSRRWVREASARFCKEGAKFDLVVVSACERPWPLYLEEISSGEIASYLSRGLEMFVNALSSFSPSRSDHGSKLVLLSTSLIERGSPALAHYVALKRACEGLLKGASQQRRDLIGISVRLPRVATSWNNSGVHATSSMPVGEAASRILEVCARTRSPGFYCSDVS